MTNKKMHANELEIDVPLVKKLLNQQFPEWAELPIKHIVHSGTDNAMFRLGNDMCVRLPRLDSAAKQVQKEQEWLPKFAPHLSLKIPMLLKSGKPTGDYPFYWSVYHWIEGNNAYIERIKDMDQAAIDLADFIVSLQNIETDAAPSSRRGLLLETQDREVRKSISCLKDMFDSNAITSIWEECLNAPNWDKPPVWLHGDLLPPNLLIHDGKLNAIIDFGLMGIGDPACDLIPAWNLFDTNARDIFRNALKVNDNTWIRGRGWALSIALIIIPYYQHTNRELFLIAKHMINDILEEYEKEKNNAKN